MFRLRNALVACLVTVTASLAQFGGTPGGTMNLGAGFDSVKVVAGKVLIFAKGDVDTIVVDSIDARVIRSQKVISTVSQVMPVFSNGDSPACTADSVGNHYWNTDQNKLRVCSGAGGYVNTGYTDEDEDGLIATTEPQGIDDNDSVPFATPTAAAGDVLSGKTFRTGASLSPTTGTMTNRGTVNYTPSTSNQTIASGYHSGSGVVYSLGGNATAAYVLSGYTFSSNSAGRAASGSMVNRGAQVITPSTSTQYISSGYHNGSGYCAGDGDLVARNIKSGTNIFGVTGTASTMSTCASGSGSSSCSGDILNLFRTYGNHTLCQWWCSAANASAQPGIGCWQSESFWCYCRVGPLVGGGNTAGTCP